MALLLVGGLALGPGHIVTFLSIHSVALLFWNILANFSGFRVTLLLGNIAALRLRDITTLLLVSVSGWLANLLVDIPALLAVDGVANRLVRGGTGFSVGSLAILFWNLLTLFVINLMTLLVRNVFTNLILDVVALLLVGSLTILFILDGTLLLRDRMTLVLVPSVALLLVAGGTFLLIDGLLACPWNLFAIRLGDLFTLPLRLWWGSIGG